MRHANSRSTLEIYSQARIEHKRQAQQRVAEAIFRDELNAREGQALDFRQTCFD
jgi:hypothetical protein